MELLTNLYHSIPSEAWLALLGGGAVSTVLEYIKHRVETLNERVITVLLYVLSFCGVAVQYLIFATNSNPLILGQNTASVVAAATLAYRFIIKPASNLIKDAKAFREDGASGVAEMGAIAGANMAALEDTQQQPVATDEDDDEILNLLEDEKPLNGVDF